MLQLLFTTATAYNLNAAARAPAPTMMATAELPKLYVTVRCARR